MGEDVKQMRTDLDIVIQEMYPVIGWDNTHNAWFEVAFDWVKGVVDVDEVLARP